MHPILFTQYTHCIQCRFLSLLGVWAVVVIIANDIHEQGGAFFNLELDEKRTKEKICPKIQGRRIRLWFVDLHCCHFLSIL